MDTLIKGIHYDVSETTEDFINKKLKKLAFAEADITKLEIIIKGEKSSFVLEANLHLRWKKHEYFSVKAKKLYPGLEILFDKLVYSVKKEKEKIVEHH